MVSTQPSRVVTSHQRCRDTLSLQTTDRAPTYMPAIACEVASKLLGREAHTGTGSLHYAEVKAWSEGEQAHAEFEQRMLQDLHDLHRMLAIDVFRMPWRMNVRPTKRLDEYTFVFGETEGDHSIWQYSPGSGDFGLVRRVQAGDSAPAAAIDPAVRAERMRAYARRHTKVAGMFGKDFYVICTGGDITVGQEEEQLMALLLEPEQTARELMAQAEDAITLGEELVKLVLPAVLAAGGDMAGNTGPIYSPASFREVVLPAFRHAVSKLNAMGAHYMFRSDGNLWAVTDMLFIEAGVPGYGEADRDAGMTVEELRKRYPDLVIWGNFSSAMLHRSKPQQVKDEAKRILDEGQGRGCFHGCSNAIMHGTPPDNVLALFSVR